MEAKELTLLGSRWKWRQQGHALIRPAFPGTDATVEALIASDSISAHDYRGGNCIHPACLEVSLSQSLAALHLQTVRV